MPLFQRCVCDFSVNGFGMNADRHVRMFSLPDHTCQCGLRRACSLVATLFEGQWTALPTSAHSRGDGSLTGEATDSCCGVSRTSCRVCGVAGDRPTERTNQRTTTHNTQHTTQQHNNTTTQQHNNTTTQQHNNTTTQQRNNTTTQQQQQ